MSAGAEGTPVFDYTSLDFDSIEQDLERFAQATYPAELWTDFNDSNFGTYLLQQMAYVGDLLAYNLNASVNETNIASLVREQNFRNIAKSFDYSMKSASPSTTVMRATFSGASSVSSRLQMTSGDGIIFQPDGPVTASGAGTVDFAATQGEEIYQEELDASSPGVPDQRYQLARTPVIDGTITVTVGGVLYTKFSNVVEAGSTDKAYFVETDDLLVTYIKFGDGNNGLIPPAAAQILATYKVGGGTETNLPAGAITSISGMSDGSPVPPELVSVINITSASDGGPRETLNSAKATIPGVIKANDRCVTLEDYAAEARTVLGVLRAKGINGVFSGGSVPILLYVVPEGGGAPPVNLSNDIITALAPKKMAGKRIKVRSPNYVLLQIIVDVFCQDASVPATVRGRVESVLSSKYALTAVDFAAFLPLQEAYEATKPDSVVGVKRTFFRRFRVKPYSARHVNKPTLGDGDVATIVTTATVQRREWLIKFTVGGTNFSVTQRRLGTISDITDTVVVDESASYELDEFVTGVTGWRLHVRENDQDTVKDILGNTSTAITVSSGLLDLAEPNESYALEKVESSTGTVRKAILSATATLGGVTLTVPSGHGFTAGMKIYIYDTVSETEQVTTIGAVTTTTITTDDPLNYAFPLTDTEVHQMWTSDDGTVAFAVYHGGTAFSENESFYVDTYPETGDIRLRDECYPLLESSELLVNPIGGAR